MSGRGEIALPVCFSTVVIDAVETKYKQKTYNARKSGPVKYIHDAKVEKGCQSPCRVIFSPRCWEDMPH